MAEAPPKSTKPPPYSESSLVSQLLGSTNLSAPPALARALQSAAPLLKVFGKIINVVGPFYMKLFDMALYVYRVLPFDLFQACLGLGLCFCGGSYVASIAAIEAFRMAGWETTKAALLDIAEEMRHVKKANDADNKKDDDGNGLADVDELQPAELLQRKLSLFATAVKDPNKLSVALGGLYTAWLAVQGTLRIEFARTITLGVSMAEAATPTALKLGVPLLAHLIPPKYHHWIPTIIKNFIRAIAVSLAWKLQVINSAIQSALRGGLMFARYLMKWANEKQYISIDANSSYLDECVGYSVAFFGFYCQFTWGFGMPFPLNLIMWPFTLVEWYIRWSITTPAA
ncbi:hypothetical protein AB1Y20_009366 [Prymnesium parvum]|uniref:Uncharacterized protein n=1 Tax=Prymnesium parvum TaxID=97485 RepID=A0AB34K5G8_PRYPA